MPARVSSGRSRTATAPKTKEVKDAAMDLIAPGMHVDIKRSDGRVHTAVVTELRKDRNAVMVEWFEKGETKGKEIYMEELLSVNPTLRRRPQPTAVEVDLCNDENEEDIFGDIQLPPAVTNNKRNTILVPSPVPVRQVQAAPRSIPAPVTTRSIPAPRRSILVSGIPQVAPTSRAAPEPYEAPTSLNTTVQYQTSPEIESKANTTVQNIQKLERDREERRAATEQVKRARELEKALDPGNPNYHFLVMIREFQATVDYRPLKMSDAVNDARISVCVRKRPLNKRELNKKEIEVVTIPNRDHLILHQPLVKVDLTKYLENQKFRFDYTFDENSSNQMVYKFTAQPLVKTIFERGNATCFAYGQTGSGKTHTMGGDFNGRAQDASGGIYALTAADVFKLTDGAYAKNRLVVSCSFFEIYGSKVFDLLNDKKMLRVLEDGKNQVNVVGLQETAVENESDVLALIKKGTEMRTAGATSANSNSSRSHAVFQIVLRKGKQQWGKFSLIDLAGNERGQDTGNSNQQTRMEGAEINKSLLALKECIRAMARNSVHVPFRSSKLTMVLRDSFMGENARTCMIAMISPGFSSCEHTLNTLRYADRVKELGADENGPSKPMDDADMMLPPRNSDDEEDDADLSLICRSNGQDVHQYKILEQISRKEEDTLGKQVETIPAVKKALEQMDALLRRSAQPDYDQDKYAKDLSVCCQRIINAAEDLKGSTEQWQSLLKTLDKNGRH